RLGLTGQEYFSILNLEKNLKPRQKLKILAKGESGEKTFSVILRIDTPDEVQYYRHGGILPFVLRQLLKA
ncbi:MAG: hypothetical protein KDK66_03635, partial [Deltaproteobacteria bacterium]|nr:hypothetical protein [Deltaproteobacteria bacterium]